MQGLMGAAVTPHDDTLFFAFLTSPINPNLATSNFDLSGCLHTPCLKVLVKFFQKLTGVGGAHGKRHFSFVSFSSFQLAKGE
jgi:hypothetical protein